jgi:hypothetical protein
VWPCVVRRCARSGRINDGSGFVHFRVMVGRGYGLSAGTCAGKSPATM